MTDLYDDPALYDLEHDGYRDDFGFYRRLAEDQAGPVLELGAGSGRLTQVLAAAGWPVTAIEPNPAMRARAVQRLAGLAGAHPELARRVRVLDADARALVLPERFALVVAPFNTLMHLESLDDQDAALTRAREHLAPGGAFACDVFAPRFAGDGVVRVEPHLPVSSGPAADLFVWQHHDPVRQLLVSHHRLDEVGTDGRLRSRRASLRQRYFQRFELLRALRAAGFADVRCYGDFERGPVLPGSTVWAFVARG